MLGMKIKKNIENLIRMDYFLTPLHIYPMKEEKRMSIKKFHYHSDEVIKSW